MALIKMALVASALLMAGPGCGSTSEFTSQQDRPTGTASIAGQAGSDDGVAALRAELKHLESGAWDDGAITRYGELLATWKATRPEDTALADAESRYNEMRMQRAKRIDKALSYYLEDLRPGFSSLILDAEVLAKRDQDQELSRVVESARTLAIARATELGPKIIAVDRFMDAARFLSEAKILAPDNAAISKLLAPLRTDTPTFSAFEILIPNPEVKKERIGVRFEAESPEKVELMMALQCGAGGKYGPRFKKRVQLAAGSSEQSFRRNFWRQHPGGKVDYCNIVVGNQWFCWREGETRAAPCPEWKYME